jgi:hypothetical protein
VLVCPLVNLPTSDKLWILEVFIEALVDSSITRSCKDVEDWCATMCNGLVAIHDVLDDFMGASYIILDTIADVTPEGSVTTTGIIVVCFYKLTPSIHMLTEIMVEAITLELSRQRCLL